MLDYDKACGRDTPSVACIVDPFTGTSRQAAFWGTTPHYLPSKFETFPNEAFLDKFL
jgi:ATP citrate (pro-S)-lyase